MPARRTPKVRTEHLTAEFDGDAVVVLYPNGSITAYGNAELAVAAIHRRARRLAGAWTVVLSEIDWRDTPAGFVPPVI